MRSAPVSALDLRVSLRSLKSNSLRTEDRISSDCCRLQTLCECSSRSASYGIERFAVQTRSLNGRLNDQSEQRCSEEEVGYAQMGSWPLP